MTTACLETTSLRIRSQYTYVEYSIVIYISCVYFFTLPLISREDFKDAVDNFLKDFDVVTKLNEHQSITLFHFTHRYDIFAKLPPGFARIVSRAIHTMGENQFPEELGESVFRRAH